VWGTNLTLAQTRVLDHPDRLENLYVAFAVLLRAVVKAGAAITAAVPPNDPEFAAGYGAFSFPFGLQGPTHLLDVF
jgi:hypothetical protein